MPAFLQSLATANPPFIYPQKELAEKIIQLLGLKGLKAAWLKKNFNSTSIEKRHGVLPDFSLSNSTPTLWGKLAQNETPSTIERNEIYKELAPKLALSAAQKALAEWGGKPLFSLLFSVTMPVLFRNRLILYDSAISIRRGFKITDWRALLGQSNISQRKLKMYWPFRWILSIDCNE